MNNVDILIVEDNRQDVEMILDAFGERNMNHKILTLSDGVKALDYFFGESGCVNEGSCEYPKLIMLDLKLPKVNGLEVLRHLKSDKETHQIPVVVFTSSNEYLDKVESYSLGANSYVVKPLDADAFSCAVSDIGLYWLAINTTVYGRA